MKRRAFLSLFGVAAAYRSLGARAAAGKRPVVGFLVPGTQASYAQWLAGFVQRMRELGWRDSDNVEIIYRATEGVKERYAEIAAEFVKLKVDVIVTSGSEGVVAARQATSAIPIVFAATADPVAIGLVESLAHPCGNVTGLSAQTTDFAGKEIELLRELVPGLQRLAILTNADSPGHDGRDHERAGGGSNRRPRSRDIGGSADRGHHICLRRTEKPSRCALLRARPTDDDQSRAHHYVSARGEAAGDLRRPGLCRRWRPHILRDGLY